MTDSDVVTLKEYIDLRIGDLEKATALARESMDKRLDSMNEFRDTLKDQNRTFLTRDEYSLMNDKLCDDIKIIREYMARQEGKASQTSVYVAWLIGIIALILAAVRIFIK